ncbi:LacI family DNA-binding transcriptional regulator [Caballeronia sp. LZ029]|nr:LacI family DNA-binding transcriptional regulator [Caballeronia sp. LZ029]
MQDVARRAKVSLVPVSRMPDGCDNVASEISEAVTAQ